MILDIDIESFSTVDLKPETTIEEISELMGRTPPWLPGIELLGNGYRCAFYMKE